MFKSKVGWGVLAMFTTMMVAGTVQALPNGELNVGAEFSYFKYEEPDLMEQTGPLFGVFAEYALRTPENDKVSSFQDFLNSYQNNYMFGIEGQFLAGQVDYESQTTGSIDNINEYLFEIRGLAGYDFPVGDASIFTPYLGIGYRYLDDNMGGKRSTTGAVGYDRESHYVYLPIGLKTNSPLNETWNWGFKVEYDVFINGTQESHFEDFDPGAATVENDQDNGYGVRGSIQFVGEMETWNLLLEPFVRYWDVDESSFNVNCGSSLCIAAYEPNNRSIEYGVKLGMQF